MSDGKIIAIITIPAGIIAIVVLMALLYNRASVDQPPGVTARPVDANGSPPPAEPARAADPPVYRREPIRVIQVPPPPPRHVVIGSVGGAAWVNRADGESLLQRGLKVYVLRPTIKAGAILSWLDDSEKEFREAAESEDAMNRGFETLNRALGLTDAAEAYKNFKARATPFRSSVRANPGAALELPRAYDFMKSTSRFGLPYFRNVASDLVVATATTNVDGKWSIPNLPEGEYYVYALIDSGVFYIEWLIPLSIKSPQPVNLDLYNDTAAVIHNVSR